MLTIERAVLDEIIAHARADAPIEACGYLAEHDGIVTRAIRLTNVDASAEHFSLDPKEQFSAVRQLRVEGLRLRAVYHSHPASPARPSQEDIRLALDPSTSYVIISLEDPGPTVKSFIIRKGATSEEEIEIATAKREQV